MSEHTKTPWERMGHVIYMGSPGSCDAETGEPLWGGFSLQNCPNSEANARHIVHCVNNHERLVEALVNVRAGLEAKLAGSPEFTLESMIEGVSRALASLEAEKGGEL